MKSLKHILALLDAEERRRAKFEKKHPDVAAYIRLEQNLRNLLTGAKLPFDILNGQVVVIPARRKITNTMIKQLIDSHDKFTANHPTPHPTIDKIVYAFRIYDEEMENLRGL